MPRRAIFAALLPLLCPLTLRALTLPCANGGPVYLTNFSCSKTSGQSATVHFDVAGGDANALYDVLTATNVLPGSNFSSVQWTWLTQAAPCSTCVFSNQPMKGAFYALRLAAPPGPIYFTNFLLVASANLGATAQFDLIGGASNTIHDILISTDFADPASAHWSWLGQGYSRHSYAFPHQLASSAFYAVGPPPRSFVVAWGDNSFGQCNVPSNLTNAVAVAGGLGFSLALCGDGRVVAWGDNSHNQTNVPAGLSNAVAIAAGPYHALALRADGTVAAWGNWWASSLVPVGQVPSAWTNIISIATGADHDLALRADGTVLSWGYTNEIYNSVPATLPRATAITAGWDHNVAILSNGLATAWGVNAVGLGWNLTNIPSNLSNVVSVSASALNSLALSANGTVAAWGYNGIGPATVPAGLSNVLAIAAGQAHGLALKKDGTVAFWGNFGGSNSTAIPAGLSGVTAIGSAANHCLAICTTLSMPVIVQQPASSLSPMAGSTASLSVSNLSAGPVFYQWQFNGTNIAGATNAALSITNIQNASQGNYLVIISNANGVVSSVSSTLSVTPRPPPTLTGWTLPANQWINYQKSATLGLTVNDPVGVPPSSCQWYFNGMPIPPDVPAPFNYKLFSVGTGQEGIYSAVVSNQSGTRRINWNIHAALPGGIAAWGADDFGQTERPAPVMSNVVAIAAGQSNSVAVLADGSLYQWGLNWGAAPPNLTNAVAVASGYSHSLALKDDGTIVSWGLAGDPANFVPTNLFGVRAIAAGWNHNVALLTNGTVVAWGIDAPELGWRLTEVPTSLTNAKAIAANGLHSLALRTDGTVVSWGYNSSGETSVPAGLSNVVAIAAGGQHSLALKSDGTVVAWGNNNLGQCSVPTGLGNVLAISAGWSHSLALRNDGSIVAWGDNSRGQLDVSTNLTAVKFIAAGGYHSVAAMFSRTVPYAVEASADLLLIANSKSTNSLAVLNYYLQHRPMVARANVLTLNCTNTEIILPSDFTNQIATAISNWLAANPTVRPSYVILFPDVPTRVNDPANQSAAQASVSCQIAANFPGWSPFVTHLNMGDTNACIAYINKLATTAAAYSPGKLLIRAGAAGMGNTNYVIDNVRNGTGHIDNYNYCWWLGAAATNGLAQSGVPNSAVLYANGTETISGNTVYNLPHLNSAPNVAGYFSWGSHSSLGGAYALNNQLAWTGSSSWFIMSTVESFNGQRSEPSEGNFLQWFSPNAFGGSGYSNTPVGAVTHVEEPGLSGIEDPSLLFGLWAAGRNFAICAWASRNTPFFMAVGDPLVCR